jgi:hypothetical protein
MACPSASSSSTWIASSAAGEGTERTSEATSSASTEAAGVSLSAIARVLGVSRQRVETMMRRTDSEVRRRRPNLRDRLRHCSQSDQLAEQRDPLPQPSGQGVQHEREATGDESCCHRRGYRRGM